MPDLHYVTRQLAVGGAIWTSDVMREVAATGITHIVNLQEEFDDHAIRGNTEVSILWNACIDDLLPKPAAFFWHGVRFTLQALQDANSKVLFHCAAGSHRSPMMLLAVLRVLGHGSQEAAEMIQGVRLQADFPMVYLESVENFVLEYQAFQNAEIDTAF